jgi:hypothetical protein
MDESEQIEVAAEPDQSDEARRTRVWRLDQFVALGFDLVRAASMGLNPVGELFPPRVSSVSIGSRMQLSELARASRMRSPARGKR